MGDEFEDNLSGPLRFGLMTSPGPCLSALAAVLEVLADAGIDRIIEPHLRGETDVLGTIVRQLGAGGDGMIPAAKAAGAVARASPAAGARSITEVLGRAILPRDFSPSHSFSFPGAAVPPSTNIGLCLGLEAVGRSLLRLQDGDGNVGVEGRENGDADGTWQDLAVVVALPALRGADGIGVDGRASAAEPWHKLAGQYPGAAVFEAAPVSASAALPATGDLSRGDADLKARARASGGRAARPGAKSVTALDERISSKQLGVVTSASPGARSVTALDERISSKQLGVVTPASPGARSVTALDERISSKQLRMVTPASPGAQSVTALDERISSKQLGMVTPRGYGRSIASTPASPSKSSNSGRGDDVVAKARSAAFRPPRGAVRPCAEEVAMLDRRIRRKSGVGSFSPIDVRQISSLEGTDAAVKAPSLEDTNTAVKAPPLEDTDAAVKARVRASIIGDRKKIIENKTAGPRQNFESASQRMRGLRRRYMEAARLSRRSFRGAEMISERDSPLSM